MDSARSTNCTYCPQVACRMVHGRSYCVDCYIFRTITLLTDIPDRVAIVACPGHIRYRCPVPPCIGDNDIDDKGYVTRRELLPLFSRDGQDGTPIIVKIVNLSYATLNA